MDALAVVRRRLCTQGLVGDGFASPAEAVAGLVAVQAQEYAEALWSLGQRVRGSDGNRLKRLTEADLEAAFARGELLRTHVLRPTWHFVTPADLRWLLRLTAPRVQRANRYWYERFGLDEAVLAASRDVLAAALADGEPRTRRELAEHLRRAGIPGEGLRLGYLFMHAELTELVCSGPRRGRQQTYALVDQRVPPGPLDDLAGDEARDELVRRWFTGHGPATVADLANWSSLTVGDLRAALRRVGDRLRRDEVDGTAWYSGPADEGPADSIPGDTGLGPGSTAHLLPMYDEAIVYRDLRVVLAADPTAERPLERAVVVDGRTVGSWRRTLSARAVTVEARLFAPLRPGEAAALEAASEAFGRFLQRPAQLVTYPPAG